MIRLLDCTLRDGAYIVDGKFGEPAIRGMIQKLQEAGIRIIECGWLKNEKHSKGSTYYHLPSDLEPYITRKQAGCTYTAMLDWDRYELDQLPVCDGKSVDAIRVVFPHENYREGIAAGREIRKKGYRVFYQAANTLAYTNEELVELAQEAEQAGAEALSVVDTFGAMYQEDLERIVDVLDENLGSSVLLGFHSHNNQQLSFALSIWFAERMIRSGRDAVVDASLCGMGRGAGNTATELMANYLNQKQLGSYHMDQLLDAVDSYMQYFLEKYQWGYSVPYFIAGMYCCHVNNIAYLTEHHEASAKAMQEVICSLAPAQRRAYDYGLLEKRYQEYQEKT